MINIFKNIASSAQYVRLQHNVDQETAANESGISTRTLQNIEAGKPVNSQSLFLYLAYLGLLDDMVSTLPDPNKLTPMEQLKVAPKRRERARKKRSRHIESKTIISSAPGQANEPDFQWGDKQ